MTGKPPSAVDFFNATAPQYERTTGGSTRELARLLLDLPELQDVYAADAHILDNACGTAIVSEEIVSRSLKNGTAVPRIKAVDPAASIVELAEKKMTALGVGDRCSTAVMPGEKLDFADDTFSHSITNQGILFFQDGAAGAKEIHRTLQPGGVAIVTSWSDLGYLDGVIRPAQKMVRPDDTPFQMPIPPMWFKPEYVERCLKEDGGFAHVEISERTVHYAAGDLDQLREALMGIFWTFFKDMEEEEKGRFREAMDECLKSVAVGCTLVSGEAGVGVPMVAIVALCRK